jgi:hypothetical protein
MPASDTAAGDALLQVRGLHWHRSVSQLFLGLGGSASALSNHHGSVV